MIGSPILPKSVTVRNNQLFRKVSEWPALLWSPQWRREAGAKLERAVPRRIKWANINRVNSKIKRRAAVKLPCRRMSSRYQCDDTVLSTVTMIIWTHPLYSCHNTAAESSRTSTTLFVSRLQQAQYKQQHLLNALAGNKEYV